MDFLNEVRAVGKPIFLGILGKHEKLSKEQMHDKILHPLVSAMGRLPDKVLVPSEGTSSMYMSLWAEKLNIETHAVEADWRKMQRKAGILRDARILKGSSHLLIFLGPRSRAYEQTGFREAKKGKTVYLVEHDSLDLCELVVETE